MECKWTNTHAAIYKAFCFLNESYPLPQYLYLTKMDAFRLQLYGTCFAALTFQILLYSYYLAASNVT